MELSKVPSEVFDTVIDFLHSDIPALKTCTLVCKEWLPASRYHLFSTISVDQHHVQRFLDMLDSPLCVWRPYIRHLQITGIRRHTIGMLHDPIYLQKLATLTVNELSLRHFHVDDDLSSFPRSVHMTQLVSTFGGVTEMKVSDGVFRTFSHFLSMIIMFPLRRLTLGENRFSYSHHRPITLDITTQLPIEWASNLRVVRLLALVHKEVYLLGEFLALLGPSLTHIYLARPQFLKHLWGDGTLQH
jgi:hypothetical protein